MSLRKENRTVLRVRLRQPDEIGDMQLYRLLAKSPIFIGKRNLDRFAHHLV